MAEINELLALAEKYRIPPEAMLPPPEAQTLKETVMRRLRYGQQYWKPLHQRMDYWYSMYLLLDAIQQMKPLGYRRFISNEPRTAVDAAINILTRNDAFWRIERSGMHNESLEEIEHISKIERTLQGIIDDADELFTARGQPPFWKQVAQQAVLRGWIWGKAHVTKYALDVRSAPLLTVIYDSRLVFPHFDQWGLDYVIIEHPTTLGELMVLHPELYGDRKEYLDADPNTPAIKLEYWSNTRPGRPGVTGVMAIVSPVMPPGAESQIPFYTEPLPAESARGARWVIPPYVHGYRPEQLPVVGVPANGLSLYAKPAVPLPVFERLQEQADLFSINRTAWQGPSTWVAESGRSLLAAVEDQIPQYNELVATIFQHFSLSAFGTWVFKTPTGELPEFEPGLEAKIALRPEEAIQRIEPQPINADAFRLLQILSEERQKGTLSNILQAVVPFQGSSVLFQQTANAALNALEPYHDAMERFGTALGTSVIEQLKVADVDKFAVIAKEGRSFFRIEFDPKHDLYSDRKYRPVPVFKPALPDDMALRMQTARLALDPRMPILSKATVLSDIIGIEDVSGELDRMWEDMANMDPVIATEMIARTLEKFGAVETAQIIRQSQQMLIQQKQLAQAQLTAQAGALGAPAGMGPESGVSTATVPPQVNEATESEQALREEGARIVGQLGERRMP